MKNVQTVFLVILFSFCVIQNSKAKSVVTLRDLRCESLSNPIAIDNTSPHFSWKMSADRNKAQQQYYQIIVSSDSVSLKKDKGDLWDSGKTKSSQSVMVPYSGKTLSSRSIGYWKVRVWDENGKASKWSTVARFGVGLLDKKDWTANFIGLSEQAGNITTPILRKTFNASSDNAMMLLHVASLGYHEVYLNGKKVSDNVLSPAVSQLNKRSITVTYNVAPYIQKGENELVIWLGTGWYKKTAFSTDYDGALVKAQLDVLQKGTWNTLLATDTSWKGCESGYKDTGSWQALRFGGERVDAKLIPSDLTKATLDKMKWYPVVTVDVPNHISTPEMTEPNKILQVFVPQDIKEWENGTWLVDMGKNLNGWFEIQLPQLPAGHEIVFEYTDYIEKGIFQDQGQSDIYVASGKGNEVFRNKFNHHAFRYVKILNLPSKPHREDIKAYLIHTAYASAASFECSDPDMNAIQNMIQYTMQCLAFGGYMVDCPHLERAGYGGDGNSSTETFQTMYNVAPLYTNWMQAWNDAMREGGSLPHVAPNPGAGGGGPYWCGFIIMAPWQTYLNYNDPRLIEKHYPAMKEWLGYVEKYTINGLLTRWPDTKYRDWFLGDWLAPMGVDAGNEASVSLVNNCFVSDCFAKMEKIATVLGKPEEAKEFATRRANLNELLQKTYYNTEKGIYATGSQLDMTYPMLVGVTPSSIHPKVKDQLFTETAEKYNNHIGVGLVGVPILTKWAIKNETADFMYMMLKKRDYPGYLNMIDNGATTTWEYWSGERSRIHNCYNGIGMWFYQAVGGILTDENAPGYKHVIIKPQIPKGITWAKTTKETPYGTLSVDWKLNGKELTIDVVIPAGSTATVISPFDSRNCTIDGKTTKMADKSVKLDSGKYKLTFSI